MDPIPIVLVEPPGPAQGQIQASVPEVPLKIVASVGAFLSQAEEAGEEWGIVLLGPGIPPEEILLLLDSQKDRAVPWSSLRLEEMEGGYAARGLSLGPAQELGAVARMAGDPEKDGPPLELHWVLRVVARARHDLNNPLTAGLAEVQLLLMDDHGPEMTESLNTIQEQFRRLRDMVADLSRLRVPRKPRSD